MDLYNGKINEFVDWVTGIDTFTNRNVTGGLQVSGGSIRDLLQRRLREPFCLKEDPAENKYRMFSSEEAYAMWKENPSDNQDLEIFNFVRPSDYKIDLVATESNGFNSKFIRYGDTANTGARISYSWSIYNDEGNSTDTLSVTYTISNEESGYSKQFTRFYNTTDADPNFSIYNDLRPGTNNIKIEARGASTGARANRTFTIVLVQIDLSSTFKFYEQFKSNQAVQVPYIFERNNTQGTAKIYFKVDDTLLTPYDIQENNETKVTNMQMIPAGLSEGQHTLQMWAEAKYNDGNVTIKSKLLYYTFTVASTIVGSVGKFININTEFESGDFPLNQLTLSALQYEPCKLEWGYYTDALTSNTKISVEWRLLDGLDDQNPTTLSVIQADTERRASTLQFIPSIYTETGHSTYLCAYFQNSQQNVLLCSIPIYIAKNNQVVINETGFYELKMSAYGKTNESTTNSEWKDTTGTITTTFTGISWNTNSGWYDNSFRTVGQNQYARINFNPFDDFDATVGKTIEIEFESEKVVDTNDVIITIGNANATRIEITPNKATLFDNSNTEVIHTNYKSNERLKLTFIINSIPELQSSRTMESGLAYIINNGILERAAPAQGRQFDTYNNNNSILRNIKIGGSQSGVRVYSMRIYNYSISVRNAYNNYLYDNEDKAVVYNNNDILDGGGNIYIEKCKNKLDTIYISGNLSQLLTQSPEKTSAQVHLERYCPSDSSKNFKIDNIKIRKHGQSTLNYPITSLKFWLNKSNSSVIPTYEVNPQEDLLLNKNRYVMKAYDDQGKPSIPSNKFVLQANYADSSGVHNGGFQRLIQKTWFNARINNEYKLRTLPQLFSTNELVHHNNVSLHEEGNIDGYSNVEGKTNKQWKDFSRSEFPYNIRISPDSFPCAVFYHDDEGTNTTTFLGQYVFMDDKKSDYIYGERSIYAVPSDPFCLTNLHKNDDTDENCVWDNKNVLRVEVLGSNDPFTSYMTHDNFESVVTIEDETTHENITMFNWERVFELIYPDPDDVWDDDQKDGFVKYSQSYSTNSKYVRKMKPFFDFHEWVVSTRNNQAKFEAEAAQHLDLYKMAAYYIFVLRFGLVDSLERNAQIKTYDGQHWHYEPWDMDIALGNKNDGGIAFDPPIDRNTKLPGSVTTYAISGRSGNQNGTIATSNWLFDALEAWPYWMNTVVKEVADALYDAGLTYDNVCNMLDEEYSAKWCELMYNASGLFKYVESNGGDTSWLNWLQGSRMTHRHWWLSNSMDYYDAKWFCGDYKNHNIYMRANVTSGSTQKVKIITTKPTYISVTKDAVPVATGNTDNLQHKFEYTLSDGSQTKNPIQFYGANFMEDLDFSEIATGLDGISLNGVYSEVLGSPLKRLNVGVSVTENQDQNIDANYTTVLASLPCQIQGNANVFEGLQYLNIRGQVNKTDCNDLIYSKNMSELREFLAMGSGLINFYGSQSGNQFTNIELPDTVHTIWMNNSTWQNMTFWHTTSNSTNIAEILEDQNLTYGSDEYYDALELLAQQHPEYFENTAYIKQTSSIPTTIHNISLLGTTGSTQESILFVKSWLAALADANVDFSQYSLTMDKINWQDSTVGSSNLLTYAELSQIAQLNHNLKGYVVLKDTGEELSAAQLNTIKSWFGDTVFTKNSSGLIIDHKRQYIQINIGGNVTVDHLGNVTLVEGNTASLNATRFSLAEDDPTQYSWAVGPADTNDGSGRYNGLFVIQAEDSGDHIAYLQSEQSSVGHDYDAKIYTAAAGVPYSTTIHVVAASYPTDLFINTLAESNVSLRTAPGYIEFPATYASASFFVDSNQTYSSVIRSVTYTLKNLQTNDQVQYVTGQSGEMLEQFRDAYLTVRKSTTTDGIKITADAAIPATTQLYTLTAVVLFASGKTETIVNKLVVQDDMAGIVASAKPSLYNPLADAWYSQFGTAFSKNNFYKIDLMAITDNVDFSSYSSSVTNFITSVNDSVLNYLINCEGIIIDNCTTLTNNVTVNGETVNQMDFSHMTKLKKLSCEDCTGLTGSIDLSACADIREVYASGTNINVIIPSGSKITNYELGYPTQVSIVNPTSLSVSNTKIDGYRNITSLDLENIPSSKTFAMFDKIITTY